MSNVTVITKDNVVSNVKYTEAGRLAHRERDIIVIDELGVVSFNKGNPITWPTDAEIGLRAIVDVKTGTLRFGNVDSTGLYEFVVSEYVAPVTSAPHIFDLIDCWPDCELKGLSLAGPEGWEWKWFCDDWVLSNGYVGLKRDEWFKYKHCDSEPAKQFEPFVSVEDCTLSTPIVTAASMLTAALGHMEDRAKTYDAPSGERSMGKTVASFNIVTGLELTEEQGWLFREIRKQVRSQQGNYRADNYEDMVAYAALRGECAARERGN